MPRYVDADALKESLKELEATGKRANPKYLQGIQDAIDGYFPQIIDDEPTADVELVKHGQWVNGTYCSVCSRFPVDTSESISNCRLTKFFDRCPHCGAKMDGGESDAD